LAISPPLLKLHPSITPVILINQVFPDVEYICVLLEYVFAEMLPSPQSIIPEYVPPLKYGN
jgi:hypothetical protein